MQPLTRLLSLALLALPAAYDVDTVDETSTTCTENALWQAYVSIYHLVGTDG